MANTKARGHRPAKPGAPITRIMERLKMATIRDLAETYNVSYASLRNWNRRGVVPKQLTEHGDLRLKRAARKVVAS